MTLSVSGSNVDSSRLHFFFTGHKNVVPLSDLSVSDLFINLTLAAVDSCFESQFVEIKVN